MTGMETKRAECKCIANALVCQLCWTFLFQAQNAPKSVFGRCSARTPLGELTTLPQTPYSPPRSTPSASRTRRLRRLGSQAPSTQNLLATPVVKVLRYYFSSVRLDDVIKRRKSRFMDRQIIRTRVLQTCVLISAIWSWWNLLFCAGLCFMFCIITVLCYTFFVKINSMLTAGDALTQQQLVVVRSIHTVQTN